MRAFVQFLCDPVIMLFVFMDSSHGMWNFTDVPKWINKLSIKFVKRFGYKIDKNTYDFCGIICAI